MDVSNPFRRSIHHCSVKPILSGKSLSFIAIVLLCAISLTSCVDLNDPEASQEYHAEAVGTITPQTSIGQSFVSRRPGLSSITIWLTLPADQPPSQANRLTNSLTLNLYHTVGEQASIYSTTIIVPQAAADVPVNINLPGQNRTANQNFYIQFSTSTGAVQINGRLEDAYPHGQAYNNNQPIDADIAFRLSYDYNIAALLQDIQLTLPWLWIIIPLLVVLFIPGWLLLDFSGLRAHYDIGEQTGVSIGLSLAVIPLVMLWTTILKLKWSFASVQIAAILLIALVVFRLSFNTLFSKTALPGTPDNGFRSQNSFLHPTQKLFSPVPILLFLIFVLTLAIRLVMIRDLATSAWVDSVHHALITRLILENGAYPASFMPYLDISPYAYHPGFHSLTAAFTWLAGLDLAQSLLIFGQILNALSIFTVYLFTTTLTKNPIAGLFAAAITGFITPMPAYYTSWGRYTELAGLLILPVMIALLRKPTERMSRWRLIWLVGLGTIAAGGLFMVHYRVIAFLACLLIPFLLFQIVEIRLREENRSKKLLILVFLTALIAILFVFPWLYQTLKTTILPLVRNVPITPVAFFHDFSWSYLSSALGRQAIVIAGLGFLWGLLKRQSFPIILLVWTILLFLLANLDALRLPGGGLINNTSVEIMLFIPISILGGYFLAQVIGSWKAVLPRWLMLPAIGITLIICGWAAYAGAKQLVSILNPITILTRQADLPALAWVDQHIPQNETMVINPFAWGYGLYAGSDGGYWVSPLAGRPSIPPPVLYGQGAGANHFTELSRNIFNLSSNPAALYQYLLSHQLHYLYLGAKGGVLSPEKLSTSGLFNPIYHEEGVWVFELKP